MMKNSPLFAGLVYAVAFMLAGTLLASLVLLGTNIPEKSWLGATLFIHGVALLIGGAVSGKRSGSKGWYHGGLLGAMYTVVVWMIGFLAYDASFSKEMLVLAVVGLLAGALGGMIGINLKK
ncbi:putative membrane protein, TIGR04086 family [Paenibacillus tianmuensis]|uniref:Putative membrane protein, TIGR04086 family n=1 Tax=Paenibacillus tianmuensis TaxID=624147 RepID=A0A1G4QN67_9BACL|nr:TIGR04086 family membrane protein [Paenibacillus tianmuensis]SCW45907.1 putative membrane protein, TIGR04086 family [Paenibacillus tianmuensis]